MVINVVDYFLCLPLPSRQLWFGRMHNPFMLIATAHGQGIVTVIDFFLEVSLYVIDWARFR